MFKCIMTPVDLEHVQALARALDCAAELANHWGIPITYVGVTSTAPGKLAHNPEEFSHKLQAFANGEAEKHGTQVAAYSAIAHDPVTEIDDALLRAIDVTGADLVVMASHLPNVMDHFWPSNGGRLASQASCSVMIVRP